MVAVSCQPPPSLLNIRLLSIICIKREKKETKKIKIQYTFNYTIAQPTTMVDNFYRA